MGRFILLPVALALLACDGPTATPIDAGRRDAAFPSDAGPDEDLRAPRIDWLAAGEPPVEAPIAPIWTCPPGWRDVTRADGTHVCDPWAESGPESCADDELQVPGDSACARIGPECPKGGGFATVRPTAGRLIFVRDGATSGDGSEAAPFGTIDDALAVATSGSAIVIATGTYEGRFRVPAGVTLAGACVAGTVLTSNIASTTEAVIEPLGTGVVVRDLAITGAQRSAVRASEGTSIELEQVALIDDAYGAIIADEGSVTGRTLRIARTRSRADGRFGVGVVAQYGGQVTLERASIESSRYAGIYAVDPDTAITLRDVALRDHVADVSDENGTCVEVQTGARATLERVVLEHCEVAGLFAWSEGTVIEASDLVSRDHVPQRSSGGFGGGVMIQEDAYVTIRRAWIDRTRHRGISSIGGASLVLEDVIVSGAADSPEVDLAVVAGLELWDGPEVRLTRVVLDGNASHGLFASSEGTRVTGSDVRVRDTIPLEDDGGDGDGIVAEDHATIELERVLVEHVPIWGVEALGDGARVHLTSARIVDDYRGMAVIVLSGGEVELTRAVIDRATTWGAGAQEASLILTDVVIRDTTGVGDMGGSGILAQVGSTVTATRLVSTGGQWGALLAFGEGTQVTLEDAVLRDTVVPSCIPELVCDNFVGIGLVVQERAQVSATRFRIEGNATAGIQITGEAGVDLHGGSVTGHVIGVNVQVSGYDYARLTDDVVYDNEVNLDANELPIPSVGTVATSSNPDHD